MPDQLPLDPGTLLDARGAVWFPGHGLLAIADVHLGFPWVQRQRGQLLPIAAADDTNLHLGELMTEYRPARTVVLGDLVHAGLDLPPLENALKTFVATVGCCGDLVVVAGNHDRRLDELRQRWNLRFTLVPSLEVGDRLFVHGDDASVPLAKAWRATHGAAGQVVMGHEHPAVVLGDGVASTARCPCFLVAPDRLVLPAFSPWSAGGDVRSGRWLSPLAREAAWTQVVAILGQRLLPVPWNRLGG